MHPDENINVLLASAVTFFLVIDPIGNAAYFAVISAAQSFWQRVRTAAKASVASVIIVALFIWKGAELLTLIHVHLPSFQIAGGLFLLLIAIKMVMSDDDHDDAHVGRDIAIFPMAVPLIAGPDTLSAALLLASRDANIGRTDQVFAGFLIVIFAGFVLMSVAGAIARALGASILSAINKVIGMLLGAYAIEFIIEGYTAATRIHGI